MGAVGDGLNQSLGGPTKTASSSSDVSELGLDKSLSEIERCRLPVFWFYNSYLMYLIKTSFACSGSLYDDTVGNFSSKSITKLCFSAQKNHHFCLLVHICTSLTCTRPYKLGFAEFSLRCFEDIKNT